MRTIYTSHPNRTQIFILPAILLALALSTSSVSHADSGDASPIGSDTSGHEALGAFLDGDAERGKGLVEERLKELKSRRDYRLILANEYVRLAAHQYNVGNYELSYELGQIAAEAMGDAEAFGDRELRFKALIRLGEIEERLLHRPDRALERYLQASLEEPSNPSAQRRIEALDRRAEEQEIKRLAAAKASELKREGADSRN